MDRIPSAKERIHLGWHSSYLHDPAPLLGPTTVRTPRQRQPVVRNPLGESTVGHQPAMYGGGAPAAGASTSSPAPAGYPATPPRHDRPHGSYLFTRLRLQRISNCHGRRRFFLLRHRYEHVSIGG
jgi:hypothetical protein